MLWHTADVADRPVGLFITLSAYGNRLHGDERGSVDWRHNGFGDPVLEPDAERVRYEAGLMRYPAMRFDAGLRRAIEQAVGDACAFRDWQLVVCNCRTNHVHVVVAVAEERASVIRVLKTRTTRTLRDLALTPREQPVWARGGSGRYLWTERDLELATAYTLEGQGPLLPGTLLLRPQPVSELRPGGRRE